MREIHRRTLGWTAATLTLLAVAACGPSEEPTPTNPETSATDATSTSTEPSSATDGPPDLDQPIPPAGMSVDSPEGATLAAGYFLELGNYMRATGDTRAWEATSAPGCQYCAYRVEVVDLAYDNGEWIEGGTLTYDLDAATVVLPTADQPAYTVQLDATSADLIVHRADGTSETTSGQTLRLAIGIDFVGDHFVVLGVSVAEI